MPVLEQDRIIGDHKPGRCEEMDGIQRFIFPLGDEFKLELESESEPGR